MASKPLCSICYDPFTAKTRQKIVCQYCPAEACRQCQQDYLLSTFEDPHCYLCKRGWNADFMVNSFPLTFRNATLRKHRRKILVQREKALLPAMQIFVEALNNIRAANTLRDECSKRRDAVGKELTPMHETAFNLRQAYMPLYEKRATLTAEELPVYRELRANFRAANKAIEDFTKEVYNPAYDAWRDADIEVRHWMRIYANGEDGEEGAQRSRREFLMRCPADDCRGFLSTAYKCGTCNKHTCSECLELTDSQGSDTLDAQSSALDAQGPAIVHVCKPDMVETAKAIKKETRACPKCAARIFKIDGCDQMWCTMTGCNTAFSWNTGHVVTGRVHNPHYYEWLRRNGEAPTREIGDIPCGGLPPAWPFSGAVYANKFLITDDKDMLINIHRNLTEFEERLRLYPSRPDALMNKEIDVMYLMNDATEEIWSSILEQNEAKFNRKKEIGQILQTLITSAAEMLQEIFQRLEEAQRLDNELLTDTNRPGLSVNQMRVARWYRTTGKPYFESLRDFTNDALETLSVAHRMAVPQIAGDWQWMPKRALYKKKREVASTTPPAEPSGLQPQIAHSPR